MNEDSPIMRWLWPILASIAGAVTALSFRPFKLMSRWEILMALFVGATFAMFVAPWATYAIFRNGPIDVRMQGGVFYIMATGSNVFIPFFIKIVKGALGKEPEKPS